MAFIFPIGLGGGFYAPARTNTSLRSLPITCRGKKTPQHTKSYHKKKCCGIKVYKDNTAKVAKKTVITDLSPEKYVYLLG